MEIKVNVSKKIMIRVITIIFWLRILFCFASIAFETNWIDVFNNYSYTEIFIECFICILEILFGTFISNIPIILIFLGTKFAIKKYKKEKLSKIDFEKYKGYYRDLLLNYSPAELSYIDGFELSYEKDIITTLLSLELKGKISIDKLSGNIEVMADDVKSENESYILKCIKNGKLVDFSKLEFLEKVQQDAYNNGLLKDSKLSLKNLPMFVKIWPIVIVIGWILLMTHMNTASTIFLIVFAIIMALGLPFFLIPFLITYLFKRMENNYIRTSKGEEVNEKLEGLKNYLRDYSMLNEREDEELSIWEDYLVYSVMFGQNKKIIDEYSRFVK